VRAANFTSRGQTKADGASVCMPVCAKWHVNGQYYDAVIKVTGNNRKQAIVTWEDNTADNVAIADIRPKFDPLPIAVIESRWDDGCGSLDTVSVKLFFELLGSLYRGNPGSFHYEMFSCKEALQEIFPRIGNDDRFRYAYVACHGDFDGLYAHGADEKPISRTVLRNLLTETRNLMGIHLATCGFGTADLARFLFEKDLPIKWVSGYRSSPDWAESSPIDMMFLHLILHYDKKKSMNDSEGIAKVATQMRHLMRGACDKWGFSIYVRGEPGTVVDLISDQSA
jgi:hypothetical protein